MTSHRLTFVAVLALASCTGGGKPQQRIVALDQNSACSGLAEEACGDASGCTWLALGMPCSVGEACPTGACIAVDPCAAHDDSDSCLADDSNQCDWAATELLCPPGEDCNDGGYCYQRHDDDCTCICPMMPCSIGPDGEEVCPPCECDCADGCDVPPPTCTCPDCPPGEECAACDCTDGGGNEPNGGGRESASGAPDTMDVCSQYGDADACAADATNACQWTEVCSSEPCNIGEDCTQTCSGSCHGGLPDDGGCVCTCPDRPCSIDDDGNVDCPVCDCECDGGGGTVCGGSSDPGSPGEGESGEGGAPRG